MNRLRRFFMDGRRVLVGEPDGSVHAADPNDPELLERLRQQDSWLGIHGTLEAIADRHPRDPRDRSEDPVARLLATVHRNYNVRASVGDDDGRDHIDNETPWCSSCNALLELAHVEQTDERVGAGEWAIQPAKR